MKLICLSNPAAGFGKGKAATDETVALFHRQGIETQVIRSEYPDNIPEKIKNLDLSGWDGIVSIGGDGTLYETINGLLAVHDNIPLPIGVIPVGTGNSFSRELAVRTISDAVALILKNQPTAVDVGYFTAQGRTYYFVNMLGIGFVSDVCEWAENHKKFGHFSYIIGVLVKAISLQYYDLALVIDGKAMNCSGVFVEICNTRYTGGTMCMAPDARMDDGLLDVVVLKRLSRIKLLRSFPKIFNGTHPEMEEIEVFRCKTLELQTDRPACLEPDGEILATTPISVGILPGKVRIFC